MERERYRERKREREIQRERSKWREIDRENGIKIDREGRR